VAALKSGDRIRLSTLRLAKAAAQNAQIAKRAPLTDAEYQDVLRRQVKMRRKRPSPTSKADAQTARVRSWPSRRF
jgi:uncharacterized protein YqeY